MEELYVIFPEMTKSEGWKFIKNIYCGVEENLFEAFTDCNNNSNDDEDT